MNDREKWLRVGFLEVATMVQGVILVAGIVAAEELNYNGCGDAHNAVRFAVYSAILGGFVYLGYALTRMSKDEEGNTKEHIVYYISIVFAMLLMFAAAVAAIIAMSGLNKSGCKVTAADAQNVPNAAMWFIIIFAIIYIIASSVNIFRLFFSEGKDPRAVARGMTGSSTSGPKRDPGARPLKTPTKTVAPTPTGASARFNALV